MIQDFLGLRSSLPLKANSYLLFILSSSVYFYGGWPFITGLIAELRSKTPGMMTLIGVAISVAYIYSSAIIFGLKGKTFFWELATLIDIMLLGHWIEMKSVMGAGKALEELSKLMPDTATVIQENGETQVIAIHDLKPDNHVLVKPGEKIPADGIILKGKSSVNESMLTGESTPVTKSAGDNLIAGSINGEGSLIFKVERSSEESFLSGVIKLVHDAQASKSKTQDIANQAAFWLTILALGGGCLTFLIWMIIPPGTLAFAIERMVTVMIITCPHALGLAVPLVVAMSTSLAASHGLLIRNRTAFEEARNTQAVVFDKTGTLTKGMFGITDVILFDQEYHEEEVITYAASIEQNSEHPIAQGIVKASTKQWPVHDFKSIPGTGAEGRVNEHMVKVVSPAYLQEHKMEVNNNQILKFSIQGKTVVYVVIDDKLIGAIALADIIRPESKEAIKKLQAMGIRCLMLTGDNRHVANWVAHEVGLDEVIAEVLPDQKANKIKEVQERGLIVAMTGDGVNDAPALAQAHIGIAVGAGVDIAIETADIILVKSNPMDIVSIIGLAKKTYSKMIQNLAWATGYNIIAIPAAAGILYKVGIILNPAVGAIFMTLSTIICAVNARLLKY
jgi:Cu2+-exporting ATPase